VGNPERPNGQHAIADPLTLPYQAKTDIDGTPVPPASRRGRVARAGHESPEWDSSLMQLRQWGLGSSVSFTNFDSVVTKTREGLAKNIVLGYIKQGRVVMKNVLLLLLVPFFFAVTLAQDAPITNREIIALIKDGISEDLILHKIQTSGCKCRTAAMDIMLLKGSGASETLISGIISQGHRTATSPARSQSPRIPNSELEEPKPTVATLFGGYTYGYSEYESGESSNWNGWHAATSFAITDWLSIAGDVSGQYTGSLFPGFGDSIYTFAAGPQFSTWGRTRKVRGFGHVMVGGGSQKRFVSSGPGIGIFQVDVHPVLLIGGGLDVGVSEHVAFRVFQSDWVLHFDQVQFTGKAFDMLRLSFGVVGRF